LKWCNKMCLVTRGYCLTIDLCHIEDEVKIKYPAIPSYILTRCTF
jgi:hypothetical protein